MGLELGSGTQPFMPTQCLHWALDRQGQAHLTRVAAATGMWAPSQVFLGGQLCPSHPESAHSPFHFLQLMPPHWGSFFPLAAWILFFWLTVISLVFTWLLKMFINTFLKIV